MQLCWTKLNMLILAVKNSHLVFCSNKQHPFSELCMCLDLVLERQQSFLFQIFVALPRYNNCNGWQGVEHQATDLLVVVSTYTRFCLLSSTNPSKDLPSLARGESSFSFFSLWRTSSLAFFSSSVGWALLLSVCIPRSTCTVTAGKQASKHACKQAKKQAHDISDQAQNEWDPNTWTVQTNAV